MEQATSHGYGTTTPGSMPPENAQLFSENQKAALGWSVYGDPQYVEHVLRYYNPGETTIEFVTDGAQFAWARAGTHEYYQLLWLSLGVPTHKGIDISDGNISGRTNCGIPCRYSDTCRQLLYS